MLSEAIVATWFLVTAIGAGAFFVLVLTTHVLIELRRLRTAGAGRAGVVVWKRLTGPLATFLVLRRDEATRPVDLTGASVWLEWDQRWGTNGACMGRVLRQSNTGGGSDLFIETAVPQALPAGSTSTVSFVPRSPRELQMHRIAIVRGTLRADDTPDVVDCRLTTTLRTGS